jgi:hypothetical protein
MVDVARLVRVGDLATAEATHVAATKLAGNRSAGFVAEWLAGDGGPDPDPAEIDLGTGGALTRLATLTASARAGLLPKLHIDTVVGRVVDGPAGACVVGEAERSLPLPKNSGSPIAAVGTLVVVDSEGLPGGAITWVRPAFDSAADLSERVPGGPHLLTDAEQDRLRRRAGNRAILEAAERAGLRY